MSKKIHLLNENLVNQIAAGEVVERPASVVKELIENSIDAHSSSITIEIIEGGKKRIRVTDDGTGIDKEDLLFALERHATSKILNQEDLFKIQTMGFRGEALASIGSVACLTLASRTAENIEGYSIVNRGGAYCEIEPVGMEKGTVVTVEDVFYNTPARLKFLKTDATEFQHIVSYVTAIALEYFHIAFTLYHDGKKLISFPVASDSFERVVQIFGPTIAKNLVPVTYLGESFKIRGWVGKPGIARSSRSSQFIFINRRYVDSLAISKAVETAYYSMLPRGKYPFAILSVDVDFAMVDVNVHPRKKEVRFVQGGEVFQIVSTAVKKALSGVTLAPDVMGEATSYWSTENLYGNKSNSGSDAQAENISGQNFSNFPNFINSQNPATVQQALEFTKTFLERSGTDAQMMDETLISERSHRELETYEEAQHPMLYPIGQIANSYILCHDDEGLVIVDQHASHERVLYELYMERAKSRVEEKSAHVQRLLSPLTLELSPAEHQIFLSNTQTLSGLGFEFEEFGGRTFLITCIPIQLKNADILQVLRGVLDDLRNGSEKKIQEPQHEAICYMACRSAIKFGQALTHSEMVALLLQLRDVKQPDTCPHGRPTTIRMSLHELAKRFGRK